MAELSNLFFTKKVQLKFTGGTYERKYRIRFQGTFQGVWRIVLLLRRSSTLGVNH